MKRAIRLLVVDDEKDFLDGLTERLRMRDFVVDAFDNGADAIAAAAREAHDVALIDLQMPGMDGEELLARLKEEDPALEVVILTGHASLDSGMRTFRAGAYDYLDKTSGLEHVLDAIARAYAKRVKSRSAQLRTRVEAIVASSAGADPRETLRMLQEIDEPE